MISLRRTGDPRAAAGGCDGAASLVTLLHERCPIVLLLLLGSRLADTGFGHGPLLPDWKPPQNTGDQDAAGSVGADAAVVMGENG